MSKSLEARFNDFLSNYTKAEVIDRLISNGAYKKKRRADYLLDDRRIIVELKTLSTDASPKIDKEMDKHRDREDFPLIYGEVKLDKVLRHLPDGEDINRKIFGTITRSVEDIVRSAEVQIDHTKEIFGIPESVGMLVILNDSIDVLDPQTVAHKVAHLLRRTRKTPNTGSSIDFVWLLFESHVTMFADGVQGFPSVLLRGARADSFPWFDSLFEKLQESWIHLTVKSIRTPETTWGDMEFVRPILEASHQPEKMTRQKAWERMYDINPYLRRMSDVEVLEYGSQAYANIIPYFLKNGPRTSKEQMELLLQAVTCFMKEVNHRGLDLKTMPKPHIQKPH